MAEIEYDSKPKPIFRRENAAQQIDDDEITIEVGYSTGNERESFKAETALMTKTTKGAIKSLSDANSADKLNQAEAARYNCGNEQHLQRDCKITWPKHCFRCGAQGIILRDCPTCRAELIKSAKNARVSFTQEQSDSATQPAR